MEMVALGEGEELCFCQRFAFLKVGLDGIEMTDDGRNVEVVWIEAGQGTGHCIPETEVEMGCAGV